MTEKKKILEAVKIGDKVIIPSKKYDDWERKLKGYRAYGIIISFNPNLKKYLIRFTAPEDEKDFQKYFKREYFRLDKPKKAKHTKPSPASKKAIRMA